MDEQNLHSLQSGSGTREHHKFRCECVRNPPESQNVLRLFAQLLGPIQCHKWLTKSIWFSCIIIDKNLAENVVEHFDQNAAAKAKHRNSQLRRKCSHGPNWLALLVADHFQCNQHVLVMFAGERFVGPVDLPFSPGIACHWMNNWFI